MKAMANMRLAVAAGLATILVGCGDPAVVPVSGMSLASALGADAGDTTGFARAVAPPQLRFPADHGSHPEFRTEWWYVTGNVDADDGRRFGVQLVFFRQALAAAVPPRTASMAARDVVLAHAALTDVDGQRFFAEERFGRLAGGMAELRGGAGVPFAVVCADWSMVADLAGDGFLPLQLRAQGRGFAFDLQLSPGKPLVLQGDRGLSRKSEAPGNASIYYSMTRLPLAGTVRVADTTVRVRGLGWLDREWSTSALGVDQVGWDWFSLQLDNGEDLMWYRLRRADGSADPWSRGSLVTNEGTLVPLARDAVVTVPEGEWTAADGAARYPARWRLVGTEPAFDLTIEPLLANQELQLLVRYWEGAVAVRGTRGGRPVTGRGYLEMTGYGRAK